MGYTYLLLLALTSLIIKLSQSSFSSNYCDDTFGKPWQPSWIAKPRDDLRCQLGNYCKNESTPVKSEEFDKCCVCSSCAVWEGSEIQLFIEYVSVLGKSLVFSDQAPNETEVYEITHRNGEMTTIPSNLCNWDNDISLMAMYSQEFENGKKIWANIVKINFENNKITYLADLSCLERLDELNLNNNVLTYISNVSFTSLTHLRKVYFSGNLIQKIDPGILTAVPLNLFVADFSNNKMSQLDVSNMISLYPFCKVNFKSNEITQLVNEANFTLEMTNTYGPGFVDFKDNDLQTFPDFKELLHLDDIAQMGKLISSGFDYRDIPLICDCHLEPFMSLTEGVLKTLWRDYMTVKCAGPPDLKGMNITKVDPERLICKLSANSSCQTPTCNCFDIPKNNTMHIDCSKDEKDTAIKILPSFPKSTLSQFISVDISGHKITNISNITQLSNISMLNVSGNNLLEISEHVAAALENATVDISNNLNLRHLPKTFQYHNVCNMYMSNLEIDCDCNTLWIETWLHLQKCKNKERMFYCRLPNGDIKSAFMFKSTDLECSHSKYPMDIIAGLVVCMILIIATSLLVFTFRYDLLIIYIRLKQRDRSKVVSKYSYDVFLSFNDADEDVIKWVGDMLKDELVAAGYRVFQADQDVTPGAERNSEVLETINKTCNFLLILSDSYLNQDNDEMRPWTENEWKYGWYNFLRDKYKNLIIINFDHISSMDVDQPQIKAFLRVGCTIDFKNIDRKIMKAICMKLGKPFYPQVKDAKGLENMKPKFLNDSKFPSLSDEKSTLTQESSIKTPKEILKHPYELQSLQCQFDTDIDKLKTFSSNKVKSKMVEGISGHPQGPFQCYYEDLSLKKTPHKPLFKINSHQSKSPDHFTSEKLKKLLNLYMRHPSSGKSPVCIQERTRCKGGTDTIGSLSDVSKCKSSILNHQGKTNLDFNTVSPNHIRNGVMDTFEDNADTFQLNMSMTNSRSLSFETSSHSNESDTRSLRVSSNLDTQSLGVISNTDTRSFGESSNTFTTSIGSSTVSFNSEIFRENSLTEISDA